MSEQTMRDEHYLIEGRRAMNHSLKLWPMLVACSALSGAPPAARSKARARI
jgi:hypothetical protein